MERSVISTIKRADNVYKHLNDEYSKLIFRNKMLFTMADSVEQNLCMHRICELMYPEKYEAIREACRTKKKLVIYGAGNYCGAVIDLCNSLGGNVVCLCDSDEKKNGTIGARELVIISPERLFDEYKDAYVIIASLTAHRAIKAFLDERMNPEYVIEFAVDIEEEVISEQYFDKDIVKYEDEEIFVDCGCYDLQTSMYLSERCNLKKVFAFEPDEANVEKINRNIERSNIEDVQVYNCGVWNKKDRLSFCVGGTTESHVVDEAIEQTIYLDVVPLDSVIKERVTFIKMDIEGSELKALEGAKELIQKYRPKLAISIYHKPEDLITLPSYILELVPEYRLYLRHYSNFDHETVLYAVI